VSLSLDRPLLLNPASGKTSFLRLLLDTSRVSPRTTKDQLASVAKFVQGCSAHTSYIRSASIDINLDLDGPLGLTLIDTPSFDFKDEPAAERLLTDILRQVDSRFVEGIDDVRALNSPISVIKNLIIIIQDWKAQSGDRFIHLSVLIPAFSLNLLTFCPIQLYLLLGSGPNCTTICPGTTCTAYSPSTRQ